MRAACGAVIFDHPHNADSRIDFIAPCMFARRPAFMLLIAARDPGVHVADGDQPGGTVREFYASRDWRNAHQL
jgi:hypothetical protein